jgi:hypothetical protein
MNAYRKYCNNLDIKTYLENNGNEYFQKHKAKVNWIKILKFKDVLYTSQYFDVMKWWKDFETEYQELAIGAGIILGKPTHNAFQERVFSRGTYSDSKLRKRLKEENFEMSVLNAINNRKIKELNEIIEIVIDLPDPTVPDEELKANEVVQFFDKRQLDMDEIELEVENKDDDENSVVSVFVGTLVDELDDDDCSLDDFLKSKMYLDDAAAPKDSTTNP